MPTALTQFQIEGLHGRKQTIDIPIRDNRLVLVGENGTGKSTVANLLYYVLTQQWRRVVEYGFASLQVNTSDSVVRLAHDDVEALAASQSGPLNAAIRFKYPHALVREVSKMISQETLFSDDETLIDRVATVTRTPRSVARQMMFEISESQGPKLKRHLAELAKRLDSWKFGQFLYLPTYRRIEQDLTWIFRGIEIEEKMREFRDRFRKRERSSYIELVEFGMEDVDRTIQSRMNQIKERVRTGLSNLTGTYLREVIRGLQDNPNLSVLRSITLSSFQSMLARIDEATLPAADKRRLESKITEIGATNYEIQPDDRVIAHFLSKLVLLYNEQQEHESDVREFIRICNAYLTGKEFVYDDIKYEIFVRESNLESGANNGAKHLELKFLSSGEKQIVSLFSHMYLSGQSEFFVVIDEPELSLSVPWQERFLPDIIKTKRCTGLVAVTHSPFIWANEFEPYVGALAEFVRATA